MRFLIKTKRPKTTHAAVSQPKRQRAGRLPLPVTRKPTADLFDARFGADFLASVPLGPGVYRYLDAAGVTIYVGRAANLRRRLSQYRLATRRRRHGKMRSIVAAATALVWEPTVDHLAACLREVELIGALKPRANVASAYTFLYPLVGIRVAGDELRICHTTHPADFPGWELHGAFRARDATADAFFALMRLFTYLAHPVPRTRLKPESDVPHARVFGFRRFSTELVAPLQAFLSGRDPAMLPQLAMMLLEKPSARARAGDIKLDLKLLQRFFEAEPKRLRAACDAVGHAAWPVAQADRDALMLRFRG